MQDFISKTDLYKKFQVDDLLLVEFKCPYEDKTTGIWWHNNFFAFIFSGESMVKTPHEEILLKPGHCLFAKKGSVLSLNNTHEDFCELLIFLPDDFIKTVIYKHNIFFPKKAENQKTQTVIPLLNDKVLLVYFQSLLSYFSLPEPPPTGLLKLKCEELILHLVYSHQHDLLKNYFFELCSRARPSIKDIMEANFFSNLTLKEFARLCARSLSSFKREFLQLYHITPGTWLVDKRLQYSKYLLETTEMTVEEICMQSGFENRSHFTRVFKKKYGITPGKCNRYQKIK